MKVGDLVKLSDPYGMAISNEVLSEVMVWWDSLAFDAVSQPSYEELQ